MKSSDRSYADPTFGSTGDKPAPADYDGDGRTDMAVVRSSDTNWYILRSSDSGLTQQQFGLSTVSLPADYDGDGKADIGVWRESVKVFYSWSSSSSTLSSATFTVSSTEPVRATYDGDGRADYAVQKRSKLAYLPEFDQLLCRNRLVAAGRRHPRPERLRRRRQGCYRRLAPLNRNLVYPQQLGPFDQNTAMGNVGRYSRSRLLPKVGFFRFRRCVRNKTRSKEINDDGEHNKYKSNRQHRLQQTKSSNQDLTHDLFHVCLRLRAKFQNN